MNETQNSGLDILFKVFSVILAFPLFALILFLFVRLSFNGLTQSAFGLMDTGAMSEMPVGQLMSTLEVPGFDIAEDDTLSDVVYNYIEDAGVSDVTKSDIENMLDELTIDEFLGDVTNEYLAVMTGQSASASISKDKIVDVIKENADIIEKEAGITIEKEQIDKIENYLDDVDIEEMTYVEMDAKDIPGALSLVSGFLIGNMLPYWLILLVLIVLIGALNYKAPYKALGYVGVCTLIAGIIGLILSFMMSFVKSIVADNDIPLVNTILDGFGSKLLTMAIIFIVVGIVLLVAKAIFKKIFTPKTNPEPEMNYYT